MRLSKGIVTLEGCGGGDHSHTTSGARSGDQAGVGDSTTSVVVPAAQACVILSNSAFMADRDPHPQPAYRKPHTPVDANLTTAVYPVVHPWCILMATKDWARAAAIGLCVLDTSNSAYWVPLATCPPEMNVDQMQVEL